MYINTHVHIHINIKAEHPPISPHNLLLLKLVTELAELFRSGYSLHTRGMGSLALLEQNTQAGTWKVGWWRQIWVNSQGRAGSDGWKWPLVPQHGTLACQKGSRWADWVMVWEDDCIDPLGPGQPSHPLSSAPVTEGGLSPALGGSHSLPPTHLYPSCLWIILPTVLKATHTLPCLCSIPSPLT